MTGILFDMEHVVNSAHPHLEADTVRGRRRVVAGDFFQSVPPGAGAYLLKNVLHDWDDDLAITILKNCRRAMDLGALLLVIEIALPVPDDEAMGSLLDLNMLAISGGRERTEAQYRSLLEASGFRLTRVIPTAALVSILEAAPV